MVIKELKGSEEWWKVQQIQMGQCIAWEMRKEGYEERYRVNKYEKEILETMSKHGKWSSKLWQPHKLLIWSEFWRTSQDYFGSSHISSRSLGSQGSNSLDDV